MSDYAIFDIALRDRNSRQSIIVAGGQALVCLNGVYSPATLYDPDNNFAALTNPVTGVRGRFRFAVSTGSAGQASPPVVDVYGITPEGHGFQIYGAKPGAPSITNVASKGDASAIVQPFLATNGTPASVVDQGLNFVVGTMIDPFPWVDVKVVDSGKTLNVGLLASESGGNESGFFAAVSIATAGAIRGKNAPTATYGALLSESNATTPAVLTPRPHVISTAVSFTWTISSGSTTGAGRIVMPVRAGVTG